MFEKRTNALTNRSELLGDCHDQSADWSRNDSIISNNNLSHYARFAEKRKAWNTGWIPGFPKKQKLRVGRVTSGDHSPSSTALHSANTAEMMGTQVLAP